MAYPALWMAVWLALGEAASAWGQISRGAASLALGLSLLLLAAAQRRRRGRALAAAVVVLAAGLLRAAAAPSPPGWGAAQEEGLWRLRLAAPVRRQVEGGVHTWATEAVGVAYAQRGGWRAPAAPVRLRLRLAAGDQVPARGDEVLARLALRPHPALGANGPLSVGERQRRAGLSHRTASLRMWAPLAYGRGLLPALDRWRQRGVASFWRHLPPAQAGIAQALALGDSGGLDDSRRDAWAAAGIAHLLCVSGLHVGMVVWLTYCLAYMALICLPGAGERVVVQRAAALVSLPAVFLFAAVCGAPVAATRAATMAGLAAWAAAAGRRHAAANTLGVAAVAILMHTPDALWSVSFWLSFLAVGALLASARRPPTVDGAAPESTAAGRCTGRQNGMGTLRLGPQGAGLAALGARLRRAAQAGIGLLSTSLAASLAASMATAPVTAWMFNQVAWAGVFTNLLAVPLGTLLATPLALAQAAAASWAPGLVPWLAPPVAWALALLDQLAHAVAAWRPASLVVPAPNGAEMAAWVAICLALAGLWRGGMGGRRAMWLGLGLGSLVLTASIGGRLWRRQVGDGLLHIHHLAVGQGDATLIIAPGGGTMLIDGGGALFPGGRDPGRATVAPYLRNLAIRRLDFMVLTHPHPDHIGGLQAVARQWPVGELVHGGSGEDFVTVRQLQAAVVAGGGRLSRAAERPQVEAWQGLEVHWLHPRPAPAAAPATGAALPATAAAAARLAAAPSLNDSSVVVRLHFGASCALFTGDIERAAEARLLPLMRPCEVLKVAHHGSRTSSQAAFLAAVQPRLAAISCGVDNSFGHPHPETLAGLAAVGAEVRRTDVCGSWSYRTDGARWWGWGSLASRP